MGGREEDEASGELVIEPTDLMHDSTGVLL